MGIAHGRCELLFTVAGGAENASCAFSTATISALSPAAIQDMATAVRVNFEAEVWNNSAMRPAYPHATAFVGARVSAIDAAGHVVRSAESINSTPIEGSDAGDALPPEVAVVVSLRTTTSGPRGRGRMYTPPLSAGNLTAEGGLSDATRDGLANAFGAFFTALNSDTQFGQTVQVASNAGIFTTAVDAVRVGSVFDSQRGRRKSLVEAYYQATVV